MSVHARAPLRIDFAGGWTDVPAFADLEGGTVVNAALTLRVHVDFLLGGRKIRMIAEDRGERVTIDAPTAIRYDGTLDLHKAALNMLPVTGGIEILSRADAPGGSGLGASGALDVALCAGLARCRRESYEPDALAELGFLLETGELGLLGGRQDQYAAALGGFHELAFAEGAVAIRPLAVSDAAARDLARHLVVAYTGHSHFSSATHAHVWNAYAAAEAEVTAALHAIKALAAEAASALEAGEWRELARVVDRNWTEQQRLHASIATPRTRVIEAAMREAGAWGLKAAGAGAGGCLAALAPADRRDAVARAASAAGARILPAEFSAGGVVVWEREQDDAAGDA